MASSSLAARVFKGFKGPFMFFSMVYHMVFYCFSWPSSGFSACFQAASAWQPFLSRCDEILTAGVDSKVDEDLLCEAMDGRSRSISPFDTIY